MRPQNLTENTTWFSLNTAVGNKWAIWEYYEYYQCVYTFYCFPAKPMLIVIIDLQVTYGSRVTFALKIRRKITLITSALFHTCLTHYVSCHRHIFLAQDKNKCARLRKHKQRSLQWRLNWHDGVSNHQLKSVYSPVYSGADQGKHQSSASLAFEGNSPVTGEFSAQRASNAENVSIWWRHHAKCQLYVIPPTTASFGSFKHIKSPYRSIMSYMCTAKL